MRKAISALTSLVVWAAAAPMALADSAWEFSVQISAAVSTAPAQIVLSWPQDTFSTPQSYTIYRKSPNSTTWGSGETLPGTTTTYADRNVSPGVAYEYQVVKKTQHYTGYGYICAGLNLPLVESRGKVVLVIDKTQAGPLGVELARLQQDLVGDGWTVERLEVNRTDTPVTVKNRIRVVYAQDPANVKAVFLFGHIPVPYSGDIVPDGHVPDHRGAWPADGYYGDMDGVWTDTTVNSTSASEARNRNVPGDGKFDQSTFPAPLKLMVGRVDLANMPGRLTWGGPATFAPETELLRNYLNKDHQYRHKMFDLPRRAVLGDFFGYRNGEAFAASGFRNFSTFFGASNLHNISEPGAWLPALSQSPALTSYGCGAGSYTTVAGLGNTGVYRDMCTPEMVNADPKTVFALLFGSWLGDWDSEDNILRGILATRSYGLASGWSGRPHWFIHHMALGESIGFGARLTQNNGANGLYQNQVNSCAGLIHVALMGDPTLRLHTVAPPRNVAAEDVEGGTVLSWTPSAEPVAGYHVYASSSAAGPWTRLNSDPIAAPSYAPAGPHGRTYMVRAVKLERSASGTYWNASQGAFANARFADGTGETTPPPAGNEGGATTPPSQEDAGGAPVPTPTPNPDTGGGTFVWVDDALPAGAVAAADNGDGWTWVNANPAPSSGSVAHQSAPVSGMHQHFFHSATDGMSVRAGEVLFADVFVDPGNPPSEIMLQWNDGSWEHRAYWGANLIDYGNNGTAGRRYVGAIPPPGQWVRLQVPASQVGLEGRTVTGMAFTLVNGRVTWDATGKMAVATLPPPSGGDGGTTTNTDPGSVTLSTNMFAWIDDALPAGAVPGADGGDSWNWVTANPAPALGARASQSIVSAGLHQVYFTSASSPLNVAAGESLFAHVYLDPANPPSQVMLQWYDGSWEHRAYWGMNYIGYGTHGTPGRRYMGPLPAAGQWVRLQVPASAVALEGSRVHGMAFTLYGGRATWDYAGKLAVVTTTNPPAGGSATNPPVVATNQPPVVTNPPAQTNSAPGSGSPLPGVSTADYLTLQLPKPGDTALHLLTPTLLELKLVNTKEPDPARVTQWDLVDANGNFLAPPATAFTVNTGSREVKVLNVGFKRRPLYAPFEKYDLRIDNSLYLQLAEPVSDNQIVEVMNPSGQLWDPSTKFVLETNPLRYSPAIHVNQEGYMPNYAKKAMVGYYCGSLGEMSVPASSGFKLVNAQTGAAVFTGTLTARPDQGYTYTPTPYQKVYEADFSAFNTPGEYRLVVPGMGGSLPFLIDNGIAMAFTRAYALGLYHQRCGTSTALPFTRHTHDICHHAPASVPLPEETFPFTWKTIADYARKANGDNPSQTAPAMTSAAAQLFPLQRQGAIDTAGGHHDAGDYSKYTANSANMVHYLVFAVDSLPGVADLDNLGIPESGDGISDILQEAKWEADFLAKLQDTDGGFYFLVYPKDREYETGSAPDKGDAQVVWPKTTSSTAAAVAALAQCASSPTFQRLYPQAAAQYLVQAKLGWQFLQNAIARYGRTGAYQKITHYGDTFADQDELAWAACEMFLATGDLSIHALLRSWFNPTDPATWRWGWWHLAECYGHAIRSYTFAARNGRVAASALDAAYLGKCQAEVVAAGDAALNWSKMNAYGTSFPDATKRVKAAGWYFSTDQAFDMAVAYQVKASQEYLTAMLANMNYEGGCNPVNMTYVTGLGWRRQRDIVSQWAAVDRQVLPPSGIPVGNIQANFGWLWAYGGALSALCFPSDSATVAPYPFYDRWGDSWNVSAEFVIMNSARSLGCLAFLAAQGPFKTQPWKSVEGRIAAPTSTVEVGKPVTVSMSAPGVDLTGARITWEARDQEPGVGPTYTLTPQNNGSQWVEAEAQLPDGRRVFAVTTFNANAADIVWCDDAVPGGAAMGADGGDAWNWVTTNPAPKAGTRAHRSVAAHGAHQHFFYNATATLTLAAGDTLYAWVYLDPANPPSEIMLQWNAGTWDHRAYWGSNQLGFGVDGTAGRRYMGPLPAVGQWVQLKVPVSAVGLEGRTVSGMAFTLFNGSATWDAAGRLSTQAVGNVPTVNVVATAAASRADGAEGEFTFIRSGPIGEPLGLEYRLSGSAISGVDYALPSQVVFPAGQEVVTLKIRPLPSPEFESPETVVLALVTNAAYLAGSSHEATLALGSNVVKSNLRLSGGAPEMSWESVPNRRYRVGYKHSLTESGWTVATEVRSTNSPSVWRDAEAAGAPQRFYAIARVD